MFVIDFVFRVTIQACFGDYNFWVVWMSTRCSINTNCTFYSFNKLNIHVARIDQNHVHPTYDDWSWVIVNYKGVCSATEVYGSILCGFNFFSGVLISVHILLIRKKKKQQHTVRLNTLVDIGFTPWGSYRRMWVECEQFKKKNRIFFQKIRAGTILRTLEQAAINNIRDRTDNS